MHRQSAFLLCLSVLILALSAQAQIRYPLGDDPAWSSPAFDDSSWESTSGKIAPPAFDSDGIVWLRFTVPVPQTDAPLGVAKRADTGLQWPYMLWVNGRLIESYGQFPPHPSFPSRWQSGPPWRSPPDWSVLEPQTALWSATGSLPLAASVRA